MNIGFNHQQRLLESVYPCSVGTTFNRGGFRAYPPVPSLGKGGESSFSLPLIGFGGGENDHAKVVCHPCSFCGEF